MQLSRQLWVILAIACALILLASNAINSSISTTTPFKQRSSIRTERRDLSLSVSEPKTSLSPSSLIAFVGVFTAIKPERRLALRSTWFPSSEAELRRQGCTCLCDCRCFIIRTGTWFPQCRREPEDQASVCSGPSTRTGRPSRIGRGAADTQ